MSLANVSNYKWWCYGGITLSGTARVNKYRYTASGGVDIDDIRTLYGFYKFDEASGTTILDSSIYALNGTLSGSVTRTSGNPKIYKNIGGLQFTTSTMGVTFGDDSISHFDFDTSNFSISLWIKPDPSHPDGFPRIIDKLGAANNGFLINLSVGSGVGNVYWETRFGSGNTAQSGAFSDNVLDNNWHHVVCVKDEGTIKIYLDNVLKNSSSHTTASANNTRSINNELFQLRFGYNSSGTANQYQGNLDEVRFYRRALGANEVTALFSGYDLPRALLRATYTFIGSGGVQLDGQPKIRSIVWKYVGDLTNVSLQGTALLRLGTRVHVATGGVSLSGLGRCGKGYFATGGVSLSGTAQAKYNRYFFDHYKLDEPAGPIILGVKGYNAVGVGSLTYNATGALRNDVANTAITFNGSSTYINLGSLTGFGRPGFGSLITDNTPANNGITFCLWVKTTNTSTPMTVIGTNYNPGFGLTLNQAANGTTTSRAFRIFLNDNLNTVIYGGRTSGLGTTPINPFDGNWHFWAIQIDVRNKTIKAYIDGIDFNQTVTSTIGPYGFTDFNIDKGPFLGALNGSSITNYFNGSIDEVNLWNSQIDTGTIARLYSLSGAVYGTGGVSVGGSANVSRTSSILIRRRPIAYLNGAIWTIPNWEYIDDNIVEPAGGDGNYISAYKGGDASKDQQYDLGTAGVSATVSSIKLKLLGFKWDSDSQQSKQISLRLKIGGTWTSSQTSTTNGQILTSAGGNPIWATYTFNGPFTLTPTTTLGVSLATPSDYSNSRHDYEALYVEFSIPSFVATGGIDVSGTAIIRRSQWTYLGSSGSTPIPANTTLNATYQGHYTAEYIGPGFGNYSRVTGDYTCGYVNSQPISRNYMLFDIPAFGGTITGVILKMNTGSIATTGGADVLYSLYKITNTNITNIKNNTNTQTVFEDLGKGVANSPSSSPTQSFTITGAQSGHDTSSGTPTFSLNSTFLTDIGNAQGNTFGIGGAFRSPHLDGFDGSGDDNYIFVGESGTIQLLVTYTTTIGASGITLGGSAIAYSPQDYVPVIPDGLEVRISGIARIGRRFTGGSNTGVDGSIFILNASALQKKGLRPTVNLTPITQVSTVGLASATSLVKLYFTSNGGITTGGFGRIGRPRYIPDGIGITTGGFGKIGRPGYLGSGGVVLSGFYKIGIGIKGSGEVRIDDTLWLYGYWKANDGTGNVLVDSSYFQHNGQLANMTNANWSTDKTNKIPGNTYSLDFNNSNPSSVFPQYVYFNDANIFNFGTESFSVSFWMKTGTFQLGDFPRLIDKLGAEDNPTGWAIVVDNPDEFIVMVCRFEFSDAFAISYSPLKDDTWHHITCVKDEVNVNMYVDGVIQMGNDHTPLSLNNTIPLNNDSQLVFGQNYGYSTDSTNNYFGKLDEILIYRRALSQREIKTLSQGFLPTTALFGISSYHYPVTSSSPITVGGSATTGGVTYIAVPGSQPTISGKAKPGIGIKGSGGIVLSGQGRPRIGIKGSGGIILSGQGRPGRGIKGSGGVVLSGQGRPGRGTKGTNGVIISGTALITTQSGGQYIYIASDGVNLAGQAKFTLNIKFTVGSTEALTKIAQSGSSNGGGSITWSNPGNITAIDNTYAKHTGSGVVTNQTSEFLQASNFGFNIPSQSIFNGLIGRLINTKYAITSGSGIFQIINVVLVVNGTRLLYNLSNIEFLTTTATTYSYGASNNVWGSSSLKGSDINQSNFGIGIRSNITTFGGTSWETDIDAVEATLYFTTPVALSGQMIIGVSIKGSGGVILSGTAICNSRNYHYQPTGGVNLSGVATLRTFPRHFANGMIDISGSAFVRYYNHVATGGVVVAGDFSEIWKFVLKAGRAVYTWSDNFNRSDNIDIG